MKAIKILSLAFVALLIVNCNKNVELPQEKKIPESPVQVIVDMVVPENDIFELFFTTDGSGNFRGDMSVRVNVQGRADNQSIVFNLPQDAHLTNVRLDVGQNPGQDEITVNKMIIKQHDKKLELTAADFFSGFGHNEFIDTDAKNFTFETEEENGSYDPVFYVKDPVLKKMKMFYQ